MKMQIAEPCQESWNAMEPRAGGRFCERCQHAVVDLSRMTKRQAEARIAGERGAYVCVRLAVDEAGQARFRSEPRRARGLAGGLVLAAALSASGCRDRDPAAEEIASIEPCPVPAIGGPPMLPVDDAPEREPTVAPLTIAAAQDAPVEEVVPTPEQRALTRRKERLRALDAAPPPPVQHVMGRLPLRPR